jgi:DNA-binding NtrC family response regulator
MPLSLQPKLLRVLQEREVDRLGDTRPLPINVRIIATTNRSLCEQIQAGAFRSDLYYRLNVVPLSIHPLRERRDDIVALAQHFVRKHEPKSHRGCYEISAELAAALREYDWPGNIRELENFIRRSLVLAHDRTLGLDLFDFITPPRSPAQAAGPKPGVTLQDVERQLLEATLEATSGNRTRTAELMGISLRTVRNKIREYGLARRSA